jgi:hypothetical protein
MAVAKPIARPLVMVLLLAGLAVYAALSVSHALAPPLHPITLSRQTQVYSPTSSGNAAGQPAPPAANVDGAPSVQQAAPPQGAGRPAANGIARFADGGPGIVGGAAPQAASGCSPKLCPRPQR